MSREGETAGVTDVLRLLLEDRERREKEADERMWLMQQQMEALQEIVASGRRETSPREAVGTQKPKLTKLSEVDDVEAFLTTFERIMAVSGVARSQWAYMLAPQLTGKAQKAFAALEEPQACDYDALKAAILKRL